MVSWQGTRFLLPPRDEVEHVVYETHALNYCYAYIKKNCVKYMCNGGVVFVCQSSCLIWETMEQIVVGIVFGRLH